jgi:DtxR family Mn-dependent transcriptional regulator
MTVSVAAEDYLKAVLKIEESERRASTSGVARELHLADATVTDMLRKLKQAGLLDYRRYHGATLTQRGRAIALAVRRRHRLIELFLHETLGYRWENVHEEAEQLEHVVSDRFIEKIDGLLRHPLRDPHGELIPDANGFVPREDDLCLDDVAPGFYVIQRITDDRPEFLSYLGKLSLRPGTRLQLAERTPFGGPLTLRLGLDSVALHLGPEAAARIFVIPANEDSATPDQAEAR